MLINNRLIKMMLVCLLMNCIVLVETMAETILQDEKSGLVFTQNEIREAMKYIPDADKQRALSSDKDLIDTLSKMVVKKNISKAFMDITPDVNPEAYWKFQFAVRNLQAQLFFEFYKSSIEIPDMVKVAEEIYSVKKDGYVAIPEHRKASHILIACALGCDREQKVAQAEKILSQLEQGESFEMFVEEYSDDPVSKENKGVLSDAYKLGQAYVDGNFLQGVFSIDKEGDYKLVKTKLGFHVVRLDVIEEKKIKTFDEAKEKIIGELEESYSNMALTKKMRTFDMSDDVVISLDAVKDIIKESLEK